MTVMKKSIGLCKFLTSQHFLGVHRSGFSGSTMNGIKNTIIKKKKSSIAIIIIRNLEIYLNVSYNYLSIKQLPTDEDVDQTCTKVNKSLYYGNIIIIL